jgi:hypothetical protein
MEEGTTRTSSSDIATVSRANCPRIEYNVGSGSGLTAGSDHVITNFGVELVKFVGDLFGPSSESGWFLLVGCKPRYLLDGTGGVMVAPP